MKQRKEKKLNKMIICRNCGNISSDNEKFCMKCGYPFGQENGNQGKKDVNRIIQPAGKRKKEREFLKKDKSGIVKKILFFFCKLVVLAVIVFLTWKFYFKGGFYGVYDLVTITEVTDESFEYDMDGYEEYYMIFLRDGTGIQVYKSEGYGIASSYQWELHGNNVLLTYIDETADDSGTNTSREVEAVREGNKMMIIDNELDQKWVFKKRLQKWEEVAETWFGVQNVISFPQMRHNFVQDVGIDFR